MKSLIPTFKRAIRSHLADEDHIVITSRVDNDDALRYEFIERVQDMAKNETDAIIDLRRGLQLDIRGRVLECRSHYKYFTPYLSIIEGVDDFKTIYAAAHTAWKGTKKTLHFDDKAMWLQIIHHLNKANEIEQSLYLTNRYKLQDFGIKLDTKKTSEWYVDSMNFRIFTNKVFRVLRNGIRRVFKF